MGYARLFKVFIKKKKIVMIYNIKLNLEKELISFVIKPPETS